MARLIISESNLVIVGAWNPAILTPNWLRQHFRELLPGDEYQAEFIAAPSMALRITMNNIQIDPTNGRLVLACAIEDREKFNSLHVLAEAISERLPHTPVSAVGFNFTFVADKDRRLVVDQFLNEEGQNRFYSEIGLQTRIGRVVTHSFALAESTLNLAYEYKPEDTKLRFNFHYNAINDGQVRESLARFSELLTEAERISAAIDPNE